MREWLLAFVQKCLGIQSPSVLFITGGKVKYRFDWLIIKRRGMRKNDRKSWERFTVCICDKCGEAYEPDRKHICRKKNSYPVVETDNSNINKILAFGAFVNGELQGEDISNERDFIQR